MSSSRASKAAPGAAAPKANASAANLLRGRFKQPRLPEVEAFTASLPFDRRLYRHDIHGSIAHARMLAKVKLLTPRETNAIVAGLRAIEREITAGQFPFMLADEDIHLAIERRLTGKIGAAGQKLHAARSRNDQVALDLRLYLRDEITAVIRLLEALQQTLIAVATDHVETIMPGYTHLQRAQPVTLAHHLLAYCEMFARDLERFGQARERTDVMPLGAGALAGTTLPIDRNFVARELGFRHLTANSIDAVSDRDFVLDFLSAAAILAIHLSRMAEEIILWTTAEFGFAELPDEFATGSSMMPQKKNPDLLELVRGKTGRIVGALMGMLTILKGLPLAYNSDLQEDKERVFDVIDTLKPALNVLAMLWPRIGFNQAALRAGAGGFALATDLAEYLVARGTPFREAHETIGTLVRETAARGAALSDLTLEDLRGFSSHFERDALGLLEARELDPRARASRRSCPCCRTPATAQNEREREAGAMRCVSTGFATALVLAMLTASIGCGVKSSPIAPELAHPAQITDLRASPDPNGIKLAWSRPVSYVGGRSMRDLGGFVILRGQASAALEPLVELPVNDSERFAVVHDFNYVDNETRIGQRYRYAIVSRTTDGYSSVPSNEVAVTRLKPPLTPNPSTFTLPTPTPFLTPAP